MDIRVAGRSDLDGLTAVVTEAFAGDPLWTWAFPGGEGLETWWRFLIAGALRFSTVRILGDFTAVAVWIPPGADELSHEDEERVEPVLRDLLGARAGDVLGLLERFEAARPREPHHYLTLLGTADSDRGHGHGMALLAACLRELGADGLPAYLESSNPANDARYERLGFRRRGSFETPDGARTVTTMWRPAAPG